MAFQVFLKNYKKLSMTIILTAFVESFPAEPVILCLF